MSFICTPLVKLFLHQNFIGVYLFGVGLTFDPVVFTWLERISACLPSLPFPSSSVRASHLFSFTFMLLVSRLQNFVPSILLLKSSNGSL